MSTAELRAVARRDGVKDCEKMSKFELNCTLEDFDNYSAGYCTVTELREDARLKGLSGYSEMCKAELIELLENDAYDNYGRDLIGPLGDIYYFYELRYARKMGSEDIRGLIEYS